MAVKTPKNSKNFTSEEIKEITELQDQFNKITIQFGQLKIGKISLEKQESYITKLYSSLENKERDLAKKFTEKYGKGSLDIETGEFTPTK